jgi:hypothetical protein
MNDSKATARPLYAYGMAVMMKDHYTFCTARSREEAAEIVQAVNSYDVMLAALKAVRDAFANDMTTLEQDVAIRVELAGVCAAIKLAEGMP